MQKDQLPNSAKMWPGEPLKPTKVETQRHRRIWQQVPLILRSLQDDAIQVLINYPNLTQITASNNQFTNFDSLKPLVALKELSSVDFSDNPVSANSSFREDMFNAIDTLDVVDHKDRDGNAVQE